LYTDVSQYVDWIEEKAGFNATMEGPSSPPGVVSDNETNVSGKELS
jgi:secreted trypsin-like serine protease